jgi:Uncharacterized conserved protein
MKKLQFILALLLVGGSLFAQRKTTTSATVSFDATTSLDALPKAENKTVIGAIDTKTGSIQFEANVRNFTFKNPTMQDHFNGERWMHSEQHPKFTFKGNIVDLSTVDFSKDGTYKTEAEGILTVKGKESKLRVPGTVVVKNGAVSLSSEFTINLSDFGITGVPIDAGKVSKKPKITVSADFK